MLLGLAPLGNVLLNVNPAAVRQRLIGDEDNAPVFQMLGVRERLASRQFRNMVLDPLALFLLLLWPIFSRLHLDVVADQCSERSPWLCEPL